MTVTDPAVGASADPGSFRDPRSRVLLHEGRVLRAFDERGWASFQMIAASTFFQEAVEAGQIVATRALDGAEVPEGWAGAVEHDVVPVITYPYEWTFSMLRDAALLQLALVRDGLRAGVGCKDGTSYNVQFVAGRPRFIDVGSFEPLGPDPWPGYRQFCSLFLYPLLAEAYLGVSFGPWLRGALEGVSPQDAAALFRGRARLRRGVLSHVTLQAVAARRYATREDPASRLKAEGTTMVGVVAAMVDKLLGLVSGLAAPSAPSAWSGYVDRSHYATASLEAKEAFVEEAVSALAPNIVMDLGCNDGRFSRVASRNAPLVVAVDADRRVVDDLYLTAKRRTPNLVTLVGDLADPSPALGWALGERRALADRVVPDLALSLALIHHLVIGRNIPVDHYLDQLAQTAPDVVLEVPHRQDPMVQRLLAAKSDDLHEDYRLDAVEQAIDRRFRVRRSTVLPGETRSIYQLTRR